MSEAGSEAGSLLKSVFVRVAALIIVAGLYGLLIGGITAVVVLVLRAMGVL